MKHFETVDIVEHSLTHLIDECASRLYENYINAKEPDFVSRIVLFQEGCLIQQEFFPCDEGEPELWRDEQEIRFSTIDNMTQKGMKVRKLASSESDRDQDTKSMKSVASSKQSASSRFSKTINKIKMLNKLGASQPAIVEEPIDQQPQVQRTGEEKRLPTPDPIIDRLRDHRALQEQDRYRENERMRKIREEQLEQEEKQKEQQKQLRNKQYTFDYDGQIVFLTNKPIELTVQEIIAPDSKPQPNKTIKEITQQPEVKAIKDISLKNEDRQMEKAVAVEYPKQPPIVEAMKPRLGTNIIFDNGYVKEGGEYRVPNKISKREYESLVDGQSDKKQKAPYEYGENDEIVEDHDSLQLKLLQNAQNQEARNIKIQNEAHYLKMMEKEQSMRKSSSSFESKKGKSLVESKQVPLLTSGIKNSKVKYERINAYKKFEDFKTSYNPKVSKLHKAVEGFDNKIIENAMWGFAEQKDLPQPQTTVYKLKHAQSAQALPRIKSKQ